MIRPGSGRLVRLVAADFPDHRLVRGPEGAITFVPEKGIGPVLTMGGRVRKRFLGRTEIAQFQTVTDVRRWGHARLRVHHTGRLKRQGIDVRVEEGSEEATKLASTLSSDAEFGDSASLLDFTRFDIDLDGERCVATVEVMGASFVSIAFPPIRSYVRLHDDQREALVGCLSALERLVT